MSSLRGVRRRNESKVIYRTVSARLCPEDYDSFRRLCPNDRSLPNSYREWLRFTEKADALMASQGLVVERVTIYPNEFAEWCQESGMTPDWSARSAFARTKAESL